MCRIKERKEYVEDLKAIYTAPYEERVNEFND